MTGTPGVLVRGPVHGRPVPLRGPVAAAAASGHGNRFLSSLPGLALPGGPTPRLRTISCNRGLTLVSPSELSVGAPAPGKPLAERKDLADQPLP